MDDIKEFSFVESLKGELSLPGDKSISHRAVLFSAMAEGTSKISNLSDGEDVKSTRSIMESLGCSFSNEGDTLVVKGVGKNGFKPQTNPITLDAGNSGTTSRLLSGILAHQSFTSVIVGDHSLSQRPMRRVADPLIEAGADIKTSEIGSLPMTISPSNTLKPIKHTLKVASAQVKSALLLAGLFMDEESLVVEPQPTRNHTEWMLQMPVKYTQEGGKMIRSSSKYYPKPNEYFVPSDISTAAFYIVFALISKNSEIIIKNVSLNPTRTAFLELLVEMGGDIHIGEMQYSANEPYADIRVKSCKLKNVQIPKDIIPEIIDEIPILSLAGLYAEGDFEIRGAEELRVKESDRIKALCTNYHKFVENVEEFEDGFALRGTFKNDVLLFDSYTDHRIAMTFAIRSMLNRGGGSVKDFRYVAISNPKFLEQIKSVTE